MIVGTSACTSLCSYAMPGVGSPCRKLFTYSCTYDPLSALVALRVGAVVAREHPLARAIELAGAEAVLLDAIGLDLERRQPAPILPSWTLAPSVKVSTVGVSAPP